MKTHFRTSPTLPILLIVVGTAVSLVSSIVRSNSLHVFLGVWAVFVATAFMLWETSSLRIEDDEIARRILFVYNRKYPILIVSKVSVNDDKDNFGGGIPYVTIEFSNGHTFILQGFERADLQEIVRRIRLTNPNAIDTSIDQYLSPSSKAAKETWRDSLRPGDTFIFLGGLVFVLIAAAWWLLAKLWLG
jgi:hypothetical protein